jgi:NhaP-type Na+/H+ or K+/H+ antiporter
MTSEVRADPPATSDTAWKLRVYLLGGLIGLLIGLLAAYFYARVSEENGFEQPNRIKTMDALKLAVALLSVVRQITDLGARRGD